MHKLFIPSYDESHTKKKKNESGFSLIELVVVVAVLSALSSIAIPSFNCFQRKAKATAALAAIRQIQSECLVNQADTGSIGNFSQNDLNSYQIQSNGSGSCSGDAVNGLISAIPTDTNLFPTFIFKTANNLLTYSFKGVSGSNFSACLNAICGSNDQSLEGLIFKNADVVMNNTLTTRGCSAYVLIKGSSWTEANENAMKLGGFLTTPNNADENQYLIDTYTDKLSSPDPNWGNGIRAGAWIGLRTDSNGDFNWANGNDLEQGYNSPYGAGQGTSNTQFQQDGVSGGFHLLMKDPSGHAAQHGGLNGWWQEPINGQQYYEDLGNTISYWPYNWGIAEIPTCN